MVIDNVFESFSDFFKVNSLVVYDLGIYLARCFEYIWLEEFHGWNIFLPTSAYQSIGSRRLGRHLVVVALPHYNSLIRWVNLRRYPKLEFIGALSVVYFCCLEPLVLVVSLRSLRRQWERAVKSYVGKHTVKVESVLFKVFLDHLDRFFAELIEHAKEGLFEFLLEACKIEDGIVAVEVALKLVDRLKRHELELINEAVVSNLRKQNLSQVLLVFESAFDRLYIGG